MVCDTSLQFFTYVEGKLQPLVDRTFFVYDSATRQISSFVNVLSERQAQIRKYIAETYSTVQVAVCGSWMRLDFDCDGTVSFDDLQKSIVGLYEFLKNFDCIEKMTIVKSQLYSDAISYMQQELDEIKAE